MSTIADFQKKNGLIADGKIGKKTSLKIKEVLKIGSNEELAHFIGQCDHESGGFTIMFENLNYSASGLLTTFGKYFNSITAAKYARQPEKIANKVYANRMGNGDEASGDGWKHRGAGPIQLTGKINQNAFSTYIKDEEVKTKPELIGTKYAFESAKFFFDNNSLWKYAKKIDLESITWLSKAINLGSAKSKLTPNGLDDRIKKTNYYYDLISK